MCVFLSFSVSLFCLFVLVVACCLFCLVSLVISLLFHHGYIVSIVVLLIFCECSLCSVSNTADLSSPCCQQPAASNQDHLKKFIFPIYYMSLNFPLYNDIYIVLTLTFSYLSQNNAAVSIHIYAQK